MNISTLINSGKASATRTTSITGVCAKGPISATVITPELTPVAPPMIVIHGISRKADELVEEFRGMAASQRRVIVAPHFEKDTWPVFQRMTGKHRPDLALLSLINTLRQDGIVDGQPLSLFGYSGGAQLAHRFAMLFPELVADLHLGAAGWYTLPMANLPYPLGIGASATRGNWHLLMESSLPQFLARPIHVYVGTEDTGRDKSVRRDPLLNQVQGDTRVERAERYVSLITHRQTELGLPATATLEWLDGCGHDFTQCCRAGGLVERMAAASDAARQA